MRVLGRSPAGNRTPLRGSSGFQTLPPPRPAKVSGSVGGHAGTSSLQKAGDVVAAAGRPHKRVGLHGDVGGHELGRVLATGPTAVPHTVVVHAKPGESSLVSSTTRAEEPAPAPPHPAVSPASRVSNLMGDGEGSGQANILVDAATSLPLAHAAHGGQAWGTGAWGESGLRLCWPARPPCQVPTLPGPGRGHPSAAFTGA